MNLFETLSRAATQWPRRPALSDGACVLDHAALWREIENLRQQLSNLGVRDGQGIGILARNGRVFVAAALAAVGCGGVVLPIDPQLKAAELGEMLARIPLTAILGDGSCPHPLAGVHHTVGLTDRTPVRFTRLTGRVAAPLVPWLDGAAFMRYASGTTGAARGVILTHTGVLERLAAANGGLGLGAEDVALCVLPMAFHFFASVLLYLSVGAEVAVCADSRAETILATAERRRATFLYAAPPHVRALAAACAARPLPPTLTRVMTVSSPLDAATAAEFKARTGVAVAQGYGIIEAGLPIMNWTEAETHPESIGRPVPGFEAAILGPELEPLEDGAAGQLALRGPGMFAGTLDPPQPAAALLREGWFLTGDLARRDAGGLITLVGRSKLVINVAGYKVFPQEVTAVLETHPAVLRSRVTGRPHPKLGEGVHAAVVLRVGNDGLIAEDLMAYCRRRLSPYKVPVSVDFVAEIDKG